MRVYLGLVAEVGFTQRAGDSLTMSDWADSAAAKLKKEREEKKLKNEQFVEAQRIKREQAPGLWQQVRSVIEAECAKLNEKMGERVLSVEPAFPEAFVVRAMVDGDARSLKVQFDENHFLVNWESSWGPVSGREIMTVSGGNLVFSAGMMTKTAEQAAHSMLNALLRS